MSFVANKPLPQRLAAFRLGSLVRDLRYACQVLYDEELPPNLDETCRETQRAAFFLLVRMHNCGACALIKALLDDFQTSYRIEENPENDDFGELRDILADQLERLEYLCTEALTIDGCLEGWWAVGYAFTDV